MKRGPAPVPIRRAALAAVLAATLGPVAGAHGAASPAAAPAAAHGAPTRPPTLAEVLAASPASDWRPLDPARTLYVELDAGRVVIELAPAFAPRHLDNLATLVRQRWFDGVAVVRSHDNYVVQWGDPEGTRPLGAAARTLAPEFDRAAAGLAFTRLPDGDVYAPEVGFVDGFPVARESAAGRVWLAHCYGMVGVGREAAADSGNAAELYVVIGHAPRHLDRNVTLIGRVVDGLPLLSALPRGTGPLGFYERPEQRVPIRAVRHAAELPEAQRTRLEVLRTDSPTFERAVEARRNRHDGWTVRQAGRVELCNVPLPARAPGG
ncbi:MAG: peptidylprolyl isomerase [Pseudomonadota bacterium]